MRLPKVSLEAVREGVHKKRYGVGAKISRIARDAFATRTRRQHRKYRAATGESLAAKSGRKLSAVRRSDPSVCKKTGVTIKAGFKRSAEVLKRPNDYCGVLCIDDYNEMVG